MSFTGREDHSISLATATQWTASYRTANPGAIKAHFFGKDAIQAILNQSNCVGIRIYYALDESAVKQLIVVGAKADQSDMYTGLLAERSSPCPPFCDGGTSPLQA
ncbi:MAG: hypothetical protein H0W73_18885 [Bacteroidetes bacterium]|nr:hypothetical protein [Bacteroidota bacterium]